MLFYYTLASFTFHRLKINNYRINATTTISFVKCDKKVGLNKLMKIIKLHTLEISSHTCFLYMNGSAIEFSSDLWLVCEGLIITATCSVNKKIYIFTCLSVVHEKM